MEAYIPEAEETEPIFTLTEEGAAQLQHLADDLYSGDMVQAIFAAHNLDSEKLVGQYEAESRTLITSPKQQTRVVMASHPVKPADDFDELSDGDISGLFGAAEK